MSTPDDPVITCIITFVEDMCRLAVVEATGFHPASVLNVEREAARAAFIKEMNKASQDSEG
jgi:hypothetical protein